MRVSDQRERWDVLRRATNGSGGRRTGGVLALPAAKARERWDALGPSDQRKRWKTDKGELGRCKRRRHGARERVAKRAKRVRALAEGTADGAASGQARVLRRKGGPTQRMI